MRTDLLWAGAGAVGAVFVTPDTVALFISASAGTYASFAMSDKDGETRSQQINLAITCVIMGCAFSTIANATLDYVTNLEMTVGLRCGIGAALSFVMRWWLPWIRDVIKTGEWVRWVPFLNREK